MATRIGLISDVHASPAPLRQALDIFAREQVSKVICAGDIAGYFDGLSETVELLEAHACETVVGNHDQSYLEAHPEQESRHESLYLRKLPKTLTYAIEGKTLFVVHAQPPDSQHGGIKLLDQAGEFIERQKNYWRDQLAGFDHDVLIVGHTHQVYVERFDNTLLINPGSAPFNHSCMVLSLPDLEIRTFALGGRQILRSWNFSRLFGGSEAYPTAKNKPGSG